MAGVDLTNYWAAVDAMERYSLDHGATSLEGERRWRRGRALHREFAAGVLIAGSIATGNPAKVAAVLGGMLEHAGNARLICEVRTSTATELECSGYVTSPDE